MTTLKSVCTSDVALSSAPPLRHGDRLTRTEFHRRYEAMPHVKKAELIKGVVYMPAAVRVDHGKPHAAIVGWLYTYCVATPGVESYDNVSVQIDANNEVQPDALLRLDPALGGRSRVTPDQYLAGAVELIVEVSGSSAPRDLGQKLEVYRRSGVQEYIVWQIYEDQLTWFELHEGQYVPLTPDEDGIVHSHVFPGLCLDVQAMLEGDLRQVMAGLQRGLASPEHAAFVERLSA